MIASKKLNMNVGVDVKLLGLVEVDCEVFEGTFLSGWWPDHSSEGPWAGECLPQYGQGDLHACTWSCTCTRCIVTLVTWFWCLAAVTRKSSGWWTGAVPSCTPTAQLQTPFCLCRLTRMGEKQIPRKVTTDISTTERERVYLEGGVLFITTRFCLILYMLNRCWP